MSSLFGGGFEYDNKEDLVQFLEEIDTKNALTLIDLAISHAAKQGAFDIDESYCIFKCISKLKDEKREQNEDSLG
jgi:hypothetical protein